jgi:hypothetical protein
MGGINQIRMLSDSLEKTLKDSDLQNVTIELAETFTDNLLNEGLLKDIPLLGTIIGLANAWFNLSERLLVKKLIYFLSKLQDISAEKRKNMINTIEKSSKYKINIGEKLIYIVDKCDDHTMAEYVAELFTSFLNNKISYSDFLRGSAIIQKLFIQDLEQFINTNIGELERTIRQYHYDKDLTDFENNLISVWIYSTTAERISIRDQDDSEADSPYIVEGWEIYLRLTDIGQTLKVCLS